MNTWIVYILECGDKTLYTGITCDLPRRLAAHASGTASRYTRGRGPVRLVYRETLPTRSSALKREAAIKRMRRPDKNALVRGAATSASRTATGE